MQQVQSWDGDAFRKLRVSRGISARDLADRIGVTEDRVRRWERGEEVPHGQAREMLDAWLTGESAGSV